MVLVAMVIVIIAVVFVTIIILFQLLNVLISTCEFSHIFPPMYFSSILLGAENK